MASSKLAHPKVATRGSLKQLKLNRVKARLLGKGGGKEAAVAGQDEYVRIKLGSVTVHAKALGIAAGRIALPKMIQSSMGLEDAVLVRNVKNPTAPEVLVINPAALDRALRLVRPGRTLGEIVDVLPFGRQGVPSLKVRDLPDAGLEKRLRLPVGEARGDPARQAYVAGASAQVEAQED